MDGTVIVTKATPVDGNISVDDLDGVTTGSVVILACDLPTGFGWVQRYVIPAP